MSASGVKRGNLVTANSTISGKFRIGDLILDEGTRQITRNGEVIELPRLSFRLLMALVQAAPNVVSIDELMETVWPGTVVNQETVSQRVKLVRDAIGDDSHQPRYLVSVRGAGYRLIAPVKRLPSTGEHNLRAKIVLGVLAGITVLITIAYLLLRDSLVRESEISIAVLPLANMTGSSENAFLADGIAETILHQLANVDELTVIARTSSFAYREHPIDVRQIGETLQVDYLLEASLQSDGERFRVIAQLVNASNGDHEWSMNEVFDLSEIFPTLDKIAAGIVGAMKATLLDNPDWKYSGTRNVEAYLAYLAGRDLMQSRKTGNVELARQRFVEAAKLDPLYARALVGIADATLLTGYYEEYPMSWEQAAQLAGPLAERALTMDPGLAEAHVTLGRIAARRGLFPHGDWRGPGFDPEAAEWHFSRAIELDPGYAPAYVEYGEFLFYQLQRPGDAIAILSDGLRLDPLSPPMNYAMAFLAIMEGEGPAAGREHFHRALISDPTYFRALARLAQSEWTHNGDIAAGIRYGVRALKSDPRACWVRDMTAHIYVDLTDTESARALQEQEEPQDCGSGTAEVRLALYIGDIDSAAKAARRTNSLTAEGPFRRMPAAIALHALARKDGTSDDLKKQLEASYHWLLEPDTADIPPWPNHARLLYARVLMDLGESKRANILLERILRSIRKEHGSIDQNIPSLNLMRLQIHLLRNEVDEALSAVEDRIARRWLNDWWLLTVDPIATPIRDDPRFEQVLAKMETEVRKLRAELAAENLATAPDR